ncbi:MAG: hypothetical protein ACPGXK_16345, partial [Phycisphaerae bacterium]
DDDDTSLGWRDGVLDSWDRFTKVDGRLAFAVARSDWESTQEAPVRAIVHGGIRPDPEEAAMSFGLDPDELRVVTTDMFTPKTIKRYTGHLAGAVYGSPRKRRDGLTPVENLYVCGTDQGFLGIIGAMLSGITIANLYTVPS